jgi:hypothetical protein
MLIAKDRGVLPWKGTFCPVEVCSHTCHDNRSTSPRRVGQPSVSAASYTDLVSIQSFVSRNDLAVRKKQSCLNLMTSVRVVWKLESILFRPRARGKRAG